MLRNKFNQGNENLYTKNYKTLMKETEEDIKMEILCSLIRRINIIKIPYYLRPSKDSMQSLSRFQWQF